MKSKNQRKDIDLVVEENIKELIRETKQYDEYIKSSKNPGKAQIWVALAILNNKLNNIEIKKNESGKRIPEKELNKILKTLESL